MHFATFQQTIAVNFEDPHNFRDLTDMTGFNFPLFSAELSHRQFGRFEIRVAEASRRYWNAWIERAVLGTRNLRINGARSIDIALTSFIPIVQSHLID